MKCHVGLAGAAGSGKDTAGRHLVGQGWQRLAFADPVRSMALAADPYVEVPALQGVSFLRLSYVVETLGWDHAKEYPDVRRILARLAEEVLRDHLGRDVLVDLCMPLAQTPAVFTDVRFPNEAQAIRDAGGIVIRLVRPDAAPVEPHVSELAMGDWQVDAEILNDGTIADLHRRIADVLEASGVHR